MTAATVFVGALVIYLTVMTATITSYFIKRSTRVGNQSDHDEITTALARLEASMLTLRGNSKR